MVVAFIGILGNATNSIHFFPIIIDKGSYEIASLKLLSRERKMSRRKKIKRVLC